MKIITVVGARPQFIKAAAVSLAFAAASGIDEVIVHTGQHYDATMSDVFFDELVIPEPRYRLEVGSAGHGAQTGEMMRRLETVVLDERPDAVLVYGDTNSTLSGALVAAKLHIPVIHVEAGLRSFDRTMPEEINRVVTDHVSSLLLCPSPTAVRNLAAEGIDQHVELVGDVMFDVLRRTASAAPAVSSVAQRLGLPAGSYAALTVHRAANTDDPRRFAAILGAIDDLAREGTDVVFPVHPRTRSLTVDHHFNARVHIIDPLGYRDMVGLVRDARVVLTDSGGLQKEAAWLGTPCVTLRETTEWTETIADGWNVLVGTDRDAIVGAALTAVRPGAPFVAYGTGDAAPEAVLRILELVS